MSKHPSFSYVVSLVIIILFCSFSPLTAQDKDKPPNKIALLEFRGLPLIEVIRAISEQTGLNIMCSEAASTVKINMLLRDIAAAQAIDSLCEIHKLWYKFSYTGVYHIYTLDEYHRDVSTLEEDQMEVFTLYYPNAYDVAFAVADLYGERVDLRVGSSDIAQFQELQERYQRFSLIENRSDRFDLLKTEGSNENTSTGSFRNRFTNTRERRKDLTSANNASKTEVLKPQENFENLSKEEVELLEKALANDPSLNRVALERLLLRKQANIHVTLLLNQNRLIIRTTDKKAMAQLRDLIKRLDIPTPLVLLEVKVLQIELGDDFNSVFDVSFTKNFYTGGFAQGETAPPPDGSLLAGGSGIDRDALIFQYVSGSFASRIQLLEERNRVTTLATPVLLTANQEVSRIFAGDSVPIVSGFTESETITAGQSLVVVPSSPITQLQDVGTSLLITPSINADHTVSLQILQEISEVKVNGATLPVSNGGNFVKESVDTVKKRSLTGTVVAKDGLAVAVGGLIEEAVGTKREQVPLLGSIPLLGMLFRREVSLRKRTELMIVIRPYILNTAAESEQNTQKLLEELSIHPNAPKLRGTMNTYKPADVLKGDAPLSDLHKVFKFLSETEE